MQSSISNRELGEMKKRAEYRRDLWIVKNPNSQIPPTEGIDTLRLIAELQNRRRRQNGKGIAFDITDGRICLN